MQPLIYAVFDTETTGLPFHPLADLSLQPRIIEFAGLITDGKEILHTEEFICNPGVQIEKIITDITGLTNEELAKHPPFEVFVPRVLDFFQRARGRIAHNESFDKSMLAYDLQRIGKTLEDISWYNDINGAPCVEICTVEQTFHKYGKRMRLQDLYELHFGPYVQKHRALDDVKLLHGIAEKEGVYDAFI